METPEPYNEYPNSMETSENALNEFLANPAGFAGEIKSAINSGNLDRHFVEARLREVIDEARNVNSVNKETLYEEATVDKEALKQKLLVKLATFDGSEKELKKLLEDFCANANIPLYPKKNWAMSVVEDSEFKADWISEDKKFALNINHDKVYVYKKMGSHWMGLPL